MNKIQKIEKAAPMPKREDKISNPMKFYTYLVCLSGLATYPENTRMFRQNNLSLVNIKKSIGLSDRTAKRYLYILEKEGMIVYRGNIKNLTEQEEEEICKKIGLDSNDYNADNRVYQEKVGAAIWKKRNKEEKTGVYHIPRPDPWTPVPEETIQALNEVIDCSELEMKIYLLCCGLRDQCCYEGKAYKNITFQSIREIFDIKHNGSDINRTIRRALLLLKSIGLIDFKETLVINEKNGKVPCFKLIKVGYYINYEVEISQEEIENDVDLKEIYDKISKICK